MVIMWANADGTVTLSQRTAPREVMPTLDPNPHRVATLSHTLTSVWSSFNRVDHVIDHDFLRFRTRRQALDTQFRLVELPHAQNLLTHCLGGQRY
jgi:hypothetical protein